jgi:hypothetical protein
MTDTNNTPKTLSVAFYLPESEDAKRVDTVLAPVMTKLWLVGRGMLSRLHNVNVDIPEFKFLISGDALPRGLVEFAEFNKYTVETEAGLCRIKTPSFTFSIRTGDVAEFVADAYYAGEGGAVRVVDGCAVIIPEFMVMSPTTEVPGRDPRICFRNDPEMKERQSEMAMIELAVLERYNDQFRRLSKVEHDGDTNDAAGETDQQPSS